MVNLAEHVMSYSAVAIPRSGEGWTGEADIRSGGSRARVGPLYLRFESLQCS